MQYNQTLLLRLLAVVYPQNALATRILPLVKIYPSYRWRVVHFSEVICDQRDEVFDIASQPAYFSLTGFCLRVLF